MDFTDRRDFFPHGLNFVILSDLDTCQTWGLWASKKCYLDISAKKAEHKGGVKYFYSA